MQMQHDFFLYILGDLANGYFKTTLRLKEKLLRLSEKYHTFILYNDIEYKIFLHRHYVIIKI